MSEIKRLCHITKWDHFDGYGFDLHAEKGKPGQYIGKVDEGSPAEAAGLLQGDRIIEVNGTKIEGKTHREVVDLIKVVPNETKLLVISDSSCDSPSATIKSSTSASTESQKSSKTITDGPIESKPSSKIENGTNNNLTNGSTNPTPKITNGNEPPAKLNQSHAEEHNSAPQGGATTGLNLNMTAAELRARLAARKKFDPKKETTLDFKKKFDMIQKL